MQDVQLPAESGELGISLFVTRKRAATSAEQPLMQQPADGDSYPGAQQPAELQSLATALQDALEHEARHFTDVQVRSRALTRHTLTLMV